MVHYHMFFYSEMCAHLEERCALGLGGVVAEVKFNVNAL